MVCLEQVIKHSEESISKNIDQETVVLLPGLGKVNVLNETGALIWNLADGTRTVADIVTIICEQYVVNKDQAETDTCEFIDRLIDKGMLVVAK